MTKRGEGRFSNVCVNSILRHLISSISNRTGNHNHILKSKIGERFDFSYLRKSKIQCEVEEFNHWLTYYPKWPVHGLVVQPHA